MTRILLIILSLVVATGLISVPVQAQEECGFCDDDWHEGLGVYVHSFEENGARLSCESEDEPDIEPCHSQNQVVGECTKYHNDCGGTLLLVQQALCDTLITDSRTNLRALLANHPDRLSLDTKQGMVVVKGCDGTVVSRVLLRRSVVEIEGAER